MPLRGSGGGVSEVQKDLTAEQLKYLDLLLLKPDSVRMKLVNQSVMFQLPKPGLFIVHRGLAVGKRQDPVKRKKDYAYILDLMDLFSSEFDVIRETIYFAANENQMYRNWIRQSLRRIQNDFQQDSDALINAADQLDHISETRGAALVDEFLETVHMDVE